MANSYTASDILKGALQKAGEKTDGTSPYQELALKCLNNSYIDILSGGSTFTGGDVGNPWPWARARAPLSVILVPPFNTGGVTVTNGSATITFDTPPAVGLGSLKDWHFQSGSSPDFYRITAHTAGSGTATLESIFADITTAGSTFNCYKLIYDLGANILRLCAPFRVYRLTCFDDSSDDGKIYAMDVDTMDEKWPITRVQAGVPERYCEVYASETEHLIRFNKYMLDETKIDTDYIPVPTDLTDSLNSIPVIPKQKRIVLEYATAYHLAMEKGLDNAMGFFSLTEKTIMSMRREADRQLEQSNIYHGALVPREDKLGRNRYRGVY